MLPHTGSLHTPQLTKFSQILSFIIEKALSCVLLAQLLLQVRKPKLSV